MPSSNTVTSPDLLEEDSILLSNLRFPYYHPLGHMHILPADPLNSTTYPSESRLHIGLATWSLPDKAYSEANRQSSLSFVPATAESETTSQLLTLDKPDVPFSNDVKDAIHATLPFFHGVVAATPSPPLLLLDSNRSALECLMRVLQQGWMAILVGPVNSGNHYTH
ncbi:unnamed protein product [Protopolystoma xenopodis]|uniref:Uncharacterized protein n=1 Tax=Protopolystoma xenopodis TaxID=117903 RepID=A0A448WXB4_9PLAT|nr:unnamed protein product [Protopolystoma xenopodis]